MRKNKSARSQSESAVTPLQNKSGKHMTTKTKKPQRKSVAKSTKRGGRSTAASQNPRDRIAAVVAPMEEMFGIGIYTETMQFALEHLERTGHNPSSLFDSETNELTQPGLDLIEDAVGEGWQTILDLAALDHYGTKDVMADLLSEKEVFDYIWAEFVEFKNRKLLARN